MDPNTALDLMREAQREARWEDAEQHAADLGAWILNGGFVPFGMTEREADYACEMLRGAAAAVLSDDFDPYV